MEPIWIIVGLIGAAITVFVVRAASRQGANPYDMTYRLLKVELKRRGVNPSELGDPCLREFATITVNLEKTLQSFGSEKGNLGDALVKRIKDDANTIAYYLSNPDIEADEPVYRILKKFGAIKNKK